MGETLFLAHRVPFPPNRGDKIRSHHLLKAIAALGPVHVGCFGETAEDMAADVHLGAIAATHCLVERTKPLAKAGIEALVRGKPVSLAAFDAPHLREWVRRTLASRPVDTIFVFSGQMGQYVPQDFAGRVVIDLCDVDSAKFGEYAARHRWPRSALDRREERLLAREEERLAHLADATLLVTEAEAELFRSRLCDPAGARIAALRNGIDTASFDPTAVEPHPELGAYSGPQIVFTGQMDYPPNVDAVERAAWHILPRIRERHPDARFHVVGRAPTERVLRFDRQAGVRVWGEVPDVRPFLAAADGMLAPLAIARGVQNKVLEAMAMARPVVLSAEAATGIDARDGEHFAIGRSDDELVERMLAVLGDGPAALAMGAAARRYVVAEQGWEAMLAPLPELLGRTRAGSSRDAA